jgi:hypothetical protein
MGLTVHYDCRIDTSAVLEIRAMKRLPKTKSYCPQEFQGTNVRPLLIMTLIPVADLERQL